MLDVPAGRGGVPRDLWSLAMSWVEFVTTLATALTLVAGLAALMLLLTVLVIDS